ncbi:MAG: MOSC domain-containing protein [Saprospiraceae bacterium]|nr:MOSC domain-containing protein [Saprospiraceae bacterium]
MYTVEEIWIYPVKSFAGISVENAQALHSGFEHDRRWMLLDAENHFVTQREIPKLCLFIPSIEGNILRITYEDQSAELYIQSNEGKIFESRIWDDTALVCEADKSASRFISDILQKELKLVRIFDEASRYHFSETSGKKYPVSLADGYPYLMISRQSMELLQQKAGSEFSVKRFRPNLVISASEAHQEDTWRQLGIGQAAFENVKPCARCIMVNVDPDSARVTKQPLKSLSHYRKKENKIYFGTNMACYLEGMVTVGDKITFST